MRPNWRMGRDPALLGLGACLYTLASPPYEYSAAAWFALTPLFLVLREKTPIAAFGAGLLYGVLFCIGIAHWVYFAIAAYFSLSVPVALLCTLLSYSFFIGVYTGFAALFSCILLRSGTRWIRWLGVPALWVCGEFARSTLFSGFSWELLGYTQYHSLALIQIADLTGVYGVSFLLALSGYVTAEIIGAVHVSRFAVHGSRSTPPVSRFPSSALRLPFHAFHFPWTAVACFTILLTATLLYGVVRLGAAYATSTKPPLRLALVHGNIPSGL
jgi:apolipoprotein N-acyltransferase